MKLIYPVNIASISADEENANYPAANLMDNHPKKVWKGTSRDAIVTAVTSGGGALAIIATNATSITIAISSGQTWLLDTGWALDTGWVLDTTGDSDTTETSLLPGDISGALWSDFAAVRTSSFTATITFTAAAGEIIQAGVILCGTLRTFVDPMRGISDGLKDYSIVKELNNGAWYIRKRDLVRMFAFSILEDRDADFYTFMLTVAKALGPSPIAWRILTKNITDSEWIVFCRFDGVMPQGLHEDNNYSQIDVRLVEVL